MAEIMVGGERVLLDASGVVLLPDHGVLVVADLHLEKASSFARRGQFLPPYDTIATLARLAGVIARYSPRQVVALGDSFHDAGGEERLSVADRDALSRLAADRDWIWIAGNHDPASGTGLAGRSSAELVLGPLVLRHEPRPGATGEIAGHLHPAARIRHRGRAIRCRAFVSDGNRLVLPAFGALTGSLDCSHPAFAGLFDAASRRVHLLGERAVFEVPASALAA